MTTAPSPSASEKESRKTTVEQGQDVSYTVNHTLSCYTFDAGGQTLAWWRQKQEEGEEHGKLWQWMVGEVLGDAAAIPFTIATQRLFPGFMHGIEKALEPLAKPVLQWSTERDAQHWASEHGKNPEGPEAKERAEKLYKYEIEHLPQAVVWTTYAVPLAVGMHKTVGMPGKPMDIGRLQLESKLLSSGALIGLRGAFPKKMHKWDTWTSKHVYAPVASIFGGGSNTADAPEAEKAFPNAEERER